MTRPTVYLIRMLAFLGVVAVMTVLLSGVLLTAFVTNPLLNGLIGLVLLLGIAWNLRQVTRLTPEVQWLETFQHARNRLAGLPSPKLLAPMASMLATRQGKGERLTLSGPAASSLLDSLASRLDESRELSRYMTGLLIFLGLLGTFWGLLLTVGAVSDVIGGMSVGSGDMNAMFEQLKSGLNRPLRGMGTAFSSSMFGLAGALVLGFLDLTAGQAQNRFFNELEEWLAGLTRLSSGVLSGGEGEASVPAYVQALLEQTAENMEDLQRILARGEDSRADSNHALMQLVARMGEFGETMRAGQQLMLRVAESQQSLAPAIQRLAEQMSLQNSERTREQAGERDAGGDAVRALRSIDAQLQRLLQDAERGRQQTTTDIRNDIRLLTRTIAAVAEVPAPGHPAPDPGAPSFGAQGSGA